MFTLVRERGHLEEYEKDGDNIWMNLKGNHESPHL
jgi:hypothetical protein